MEDGTKILLFVGGAAAAWFLLENEWEKLSAEEKASLAYSANLPPNVGWKQKILSLYARFRGTFQPGILPEPGVSVAADRGAGPGPYLGAPKNLLRVAGVVRRIENQDPRENAMIEVPIFADTVLIDSALENQSTEPRAGALKARLLIGSTPYFIESKPIDMPPGAFRQVTIRVPRDYSYKGEMDLAIQWEGYTLDSVKFSVL